MSHNTQAVLPPIKTLFDALQNDQKLLTVPYSNNNIDSNYKQTLSPPLSPSAFNTNYTTASSTGSATRMHPHQTKFQYVQDPLMKDHSTFRRNSSVHYYPHTRFTANIVSNGNSHNTKQPISPTVQHQSLPPARRVVKPTSEHVGQNNKSPGGGKRSNLPKETVQILNTWLLSHLQNPYPTPAEKNELLRQTGLTKIQLSNWFINVRRRKVFTDYYDNVKYKNGGGRNTSS